MKLGTSGSRQANLGRWLALIAITLTNAALAHPQAELDINQVVQQSIIGERDCTKEDLQFALLAQSSGSLKSESALTENCRTVKLAWLPSAHIVRVTGVRDIDVFVGLTIVQANDKSRLRFVKALGGMVAMKDQENNRTNKGAFNELLRVSSYMPSEEQMFDLGALYLFMVGHPPDESPKTLRETMMVNDMMGFTSRKGRWTTVIIHQRTSMFGNPGSEWILKFHNERAHLKLVSVAPESAPK